MIPLPSQLPGRLRSRTHGLGARPGNSVHGIDASHNPRSRVVDGGREPTVRNISRSLTPVLRRPYPVPGWRTASTRGRAAHSRQMSWAVATSIHSPRTFTCPRTRKRTNPRAPLICPKTGSTIAVRIAYTAPGCGPRLPVHPLADGEGLRGPATRRRGHGLGVLHLLRGAGQVGVRGHRRTGAFAEIPRVGGEACGRSPGVLRDRRSHGLQVGGIGGLRRHGRRDKDVMRGIDGGLGVLGVHKRPLGVLHDVRVGIRQVVLDAVGRSVAPRRRGSPPPRHGVGMAAGNGGGTYQSARVSRARATT